LAFDTEALKKSVAELDTGAFVSSLKIYKEQLNSAIKTQDFGSLFADALFQSQTGGSSAFGGAFGDAMLDPQVDITAITKDMTEQILALGTLEEKYAAINDVAEKMGVTQKELLTNILPDLGSAMGDGAVAAAEFQEEISRAETAQELWALSLGATDQQLRSLEAGLTTAAGGFIKLGDALTNAYDTSGAAGTGGGLAGFASTLTTQIGEFETFYGNLGGLVRNGGVQLATLFAQQGPSASQALVDALALDSSQISQLEAQMSLAAFYASEEFAKTFSQNNSLLAQVWRDSGNNPEAVAAVNQALSDSMRGAAIDPSVLAELGAKYGITFDASLLPTIDDNAFDIAQAALSAKQLNVRVNPQIGIRPNGAGGLSPLAETVQTWQVELDGNVLILPVNPNTAQGQALLREWRDNEFQTPVSIQAFAQTSAAEIAMNNWRANQESRGLRIGVSVGGGGSLTQTRPVATGGLIHNRDVVRNNYPGFAGGTILRGRGTGTSDSILARVSNGEAITKARAVRHYGPRMMEDINNMRFPKFANGGFPMGNPGGGGGYGGPRVQVEVNQYNPVTRDPLKQLREDSENLVAGLWGSN